VNDQPAGPFLSYPVRRYGATSATSGDFPGAPVLNGTAHRLRVERQPDELAFDSIEHMTLASATTPTVRAFTTSIRKHVRQISHSETIGLLHDFGLQLMPIGRGG
jgi:hypothetical protein